MSSLSSGGSSQINIINRSSQHDSVSLLANLEYKRVNERPLHLHLLIPDKIDAPLPLICWIQGSAFGAFGPQDTFLRLPELVQFAKNGYVVASIEHRTCHEAKFPAQIEDVKNAVGYLKRNATQYFIDPNRVGAWGNSSGGYLAAFLGTSANVSEFNLESVDESLDSSIVFKQLLIGMDQLTFCK